MGSAPGCDAPKNNPPYDKCRHDSGFSLPKVKFSFASQAAIEGISVVILFYFPNLVFQYTPPVDFAGAINSLPLSPLTFASRNAYNMVVQDQGHRLYAGLVSSMTLRLTEMSQRVGAAQDDSFLEELHRSWEEHCRAVRLIRDVLVYMDRTYVLASARLPVQRLGPHLWPRSVVGSDDVGPRLTSCLLRQIQRERDGEAVDRGLMKKITQMLWGLGPAVYEGLVEKPFLEASAAFYRGERRRLLAQGDCGRYLRSVDGRLLEEAQRVAECLQMQTERKIAKVVEREMIEGQTRRLIRMERSGLAAVLAGPKAAARGDLAVMYRLFSRVPGGLSELRGAVGAHLRRWGEELVSDPERQRRPLELVRSLITEMEDYDRIVGESFCGDKRFAGEIASSFRHAASLCGRFPELVSRYADEAFRRGLEGAGAAEVGLLVRRVTTLFRCLEEKAAFEKHHRQHLAERLLQGGIAYQEAEKRLIAQLRAECGHQFTSKLEGMVQDMNVSKATMRAFRASSLYPGDEPAIAVLVLTAAHWPAFPEGPCLLPAEMLQLRDRFRRYYLGVHPARRLAWSSSLGTAVLAAEFREGERHEITVSVQQMSVLLLFNSADRLTFREIEEGTGIPEPVLKRALLSMSMIRGRDVLRKEPMSPEVAEDHAFHFNGSFTCRSHRLRMWMLPPAHKEPAAAEPRQQAEGDRRPQIDAAVVRLMKSRRVLGHDDLIAEVTSQLRPRFSPDAVEIKRRIELLIDREYLERDELDMKVYRYIV